MSTRRAHRSLSGDCWDGRGIVRAFTMWRIFRLDTLVFQRHILELRQKNKVGQR